MTPVRVGERTCDERRPPGASRRRARRRPDPPLPSAADRPGPSEPPLTGRSRRQPPPTRTRRHRSTALSRLAPSRRPTRPCRLIGPPAPGRVRPPTGRRRYRRRGPGGPRCARPDLMTRAQSGTSRSRVVGGGGCRSSGAYWRCCSPACSGARSGWCSPSGMTTGTVRGPPLASADQRPQRPADQRGPDVGGAHQ